MNQNAISNADQAMDRFIRIAKENMKKEQQERYIDGRINKTRKRSIPSTVKRLVWNEYIGEDIGKAKCMCCKTTDITQLSFHCGHIVPEATGGEISVNNLRPICQNCNSSMGTMNMDDFMSTYKL